MQTERLDRGHPAGDLFEGAHCLEGFAHEYARLVAFREAADYVEENGLTVYGFASVMDKETVLRLTEVYVVYTEKY